MFYFLLWSLISSFLLGFWLWSIYVLYRQKTAWRDYAEKRKLRYEGGGFYDSPRISGMVEGYTISAFTGDHSEFDARSQRRLSSVEINLKTTIPGKMAVATGGMVEVMKFVNLQQEYRPEFSGWDDSYVVRTSEQALAAAYLTPERLSALLSLTKIKNAWLVLVFLDGNGLLRIDLPDPVTEPKKLDILFKKMTEIAGILELGRGEEVSIIRKTREIKDGQSVIKVEDDSVFTQPTALSFELEEDEGEAPAASAPEKSA